MMNVYVIDQCELHGFASVYRAACAATKGDFTSLRTFGLFGYTTETAHDLCKMIERAWLCDSQTLTFHAIRKAKSNHEPTR